MTKEFYNKGKRIMKKILFFALTLCVCMTGNSFGKGKCKLAPDCSGGGHRGQGYNVLRTDGQRGYSFDSGQCYRCNWGPNEYECAQGTVVAIVHNDYYKTGEVKGLFTCSDEGTSDDDWMPTDPTMTCDPTKVDVKEFAKKMDREENYIVVSGVDHTTRHYLLGGGAKTGAVKDSSGDSVILSSGSDACIAYLCEKGYKANANHSECVKEYVAPAQCTGANEINAPEEIILTTVCPECQQIKKDQCVDKDMFACYKAIKYRPNNAKWNAVWNDVNACICTPATKYEWDRDSGTCIEKKQSGLCEQLRIQGASAERLACCRAGNATTWKSGASITSTDASNCTCVDTSKKWDGKSCVDDKLNNNFGGNDNCELQTLDYISCLNGREIIKGTKITISAKDLEGMSCAEFGLKYSGNIDFLREKFCNDSRYSREVVLDAQTKKAIENMNAFFKMAEEDITVWRTEEGKFNTARLASDATAGVVLGTVGGVVSAKVIKKNQLEKGYDALKCTIGGQKMADWGDVFNVGLRR